MPMRKPSTKVQLLATKNVVYVQTKDKVLTRHGEEVDLVQTLCLTPKLARELASELNKAVEIQAERRRSIFQAWKEDFIQ